MPDEEPQEAPTAQNEDPTKEAESANDAAITQIREVVKWLIAAFASVGVALAAGSQLSDVGSLDGARLFGAFGFAVLTLVGIALAITFAVKVLTPSRSSLRLLAHDEAHTAIGKQIAEDPSLLLGIGSSIAEFEQQRNDALKAENEAWTRQKSQPEDPALLAAAQKASSERSRIDEVMVWLLSLARYAEVSDSFKKALRVMLAAAAVAAIGITGFAWAAHPKAKEDESATEPAAAKAPAEIEVNLSKEGEEGLSEHLGAQCDPDHLLAVAVAGEPEALDVVTLPTDNCETVRFTLTSDLGTYTNVEAVPTQPVPTPPSQTGSLPPLPHG